MLDMNEKLIGIKKTIAMDIRPEAGADPIRIRVEYDFSDATIQDVVDWATHASGLRVAFQNAQRPKGRAHLLNLSAQGTVQYAVKSPGTRAIGEVTHAEILLRVLGIERYKEMLAVYDGNVEALWSAFFQKAREIEM